MFSKIFLIFLIIPLIEVFVLFKIGSIIGFGYTILLTIITAALGAHLAKSQGLSVWFDMQSQLNSGIMPTKKIIEGVLLLIAAIMLLTPGILTDIIGFAFLAPKTRHFFVPIIIKAFNKKDLKTSNDSEFTDYEIIDE